MKDQFTSQFFAGNRQRLRSVANNELIVITANGVLQKSADATFELAQDGSFWYLTGIDEPDVILVMDGASEYLIVPGRDKIIEIFDGRINPVMLQKLSGVQEILDEKAGWNRLKDRLKQTKKVATLAALPGRVESHDFYANPARARLIRRLKTAHQGIEIDDIRLPLARLRSIKQPLEVRAIEAAIELTTEALNRVKKLLPKLTYEYQLAAEINYCFGKVGAQSAWQPIVAAGNHACQLHYRASHGRLKSGELVVIDIGAQVNHYVADITRTWAGGGQTTARQQAIHAAVVATQQFATAQLQPGMLHKEYQLVVEKFLGEQLRTLGLITTLDRDSVHCYCPHTISHFLGIDPHDAGDYAQPLAAGMVLTVEPGIYIPEEGIGVRIEDDVLITETGARVLSENLSSRLMVE